MSRWSTAAKVAENKARHPEHYCPEPHCLWRTADGSRCPRHQREAIPSTAQPHDIARSLAQNGGRS